MSTTDTPVRMVELGTDRLLSVVERLVAEPGPGEVLLDIACCGICGSDLHFREVPALFPDGTVPGHEVAGRVAAVGADVDGWPTGTRVCVLPFAQCGTCEQCLSGNEQVCPVAVANGVGLGTGRPGGYAERMVVDASMLFALPDAVDDRAATLVEPLAVALHAVERSGAEPGLPVVVLGAGPIGLLIALVLRARGHEPLLVSRNPARAAVAAGLGLDTCAPAEAAGRPAPAWVFECAGTADAAAAAIDMLRPLGRLILVGIAPDPLLIAAPSVVLTEKEILGALTYRRRDFDAAIELLAAGAIPVSDIITATVGLERAEEMFQALTARGNTHVKVLLEP